MTQKDEIEQLKRIHKAAIEECHQLLKSQEFEYERKLSTINRTLIHYQTVINCIADKEIKRQIELELDRIYGGERREEVKSVMEVLKLTRS